MTTHVNGYTAPAELADLAGLRYVNDDEPGCARKPWGRGFTYYDEKGKRVTDQERRQTFEALVIPPAWTDVWICASPDGHVQATGRDEKGRKQYIYHPRWEEVRDQVKYERLAEFGETLPQLRDQVAQDLRSRSLSQRKVTALVVRLLDETLLRIGNESYVEENGSYGLTTLQKEHATISGSHLNFSFLGKSGKEQEVILRNKRLASLVQRCQELPGQHLFQYTGEDGELHAISSTLVNDYLREWIGQDFTAKKFRTWGATVAAATRLVELGEPETEEMAKTNLVAAVKHAADLLGNTPAVCRQYYLHPAIEAAYKDGALIATIDDIQSGKGARKEGLSEMETAVLSLLQS
jgi:DNA topoisomerase-1